MAFKIGVGLIAIPIETELGREQFDYFDLLSLNLVMQLSNRPLTASLHARGEPYTNPQPLLEFAPTSVID